MLSLHLFLLLSIVNYGCLIMLWNHSKYKELTSLFEHFIVAGPHPDANLEKVEDAFAREKKWKSGMEKSDLLDFKSIHRRAPSFPTLEPQVSHTSNLNMV